MIHFRKIKPLIQELEKSTKHERVEFFKNPEHFVFWWYYHFYNNFKTDLAPFHYEWIKDITINRDLSILIKGFRGSIKTEIVKVYLVYCICYKIEPYIVIQSFDSSSSEDMVRNVARMLMNESLVKDY